ncbi:5-formyltetrahydrofolate cyclo-ligase [Deinococcus sp. MIMF12]|uniref:5-formyltetrahydrofolate cyclo-ligase n=1 Tax=Deinococcus rhizophilus TaxID=3049544 RepID=A0ABT7JHF1_9DEIO|nr:5-formyltetrahydrofolate cyclo-ligase [Deinococcus rhizophilus]MDL2343893.1 5-formyltetrahydrofolate cyclo-ligase [Deinococcus rhizophilus]
MTLPGAHREAVWTRLMRERACAYPLPPHGHHPNFIGAAGAARALLSHPEVARHRTLIVGGDRVLYPLRKLALASGVTLYVPHQTREGWYWRLTDPAGAQLRAMARVGEPSLKPEGAGAAVLACVAADRAGGRLGKGFGWGARGLGLGLPEHTLAHPLMLWDALPCPPDSRVRLIGGPGRVVTAAPGDPLPGGG